MRLIGKYALLALLIAAPGCKKSPGNVRLQQVNDALLQAGFKLDSFHPADAKHFAAQNCAAGTLDGVEAVVCEYGVPVTGQALGQQAGEAFIGQAPTGAVLINGATLLALADRAHADPNGRTIQKITRAYRTLR
jgi:hypothetical protein